MDSNSDELEKNDSIKNKIISLDDVLTILRNKHETNLKLNNKCKKLLKKYLEVVEENITFKKKYEELKQSFGDDSLNNSTLKKEYHALNNEYNKIQQNHFEYVNNSELKYQSACLRINELEKEIEVYNLERTSKCTSKLKKVKHLQIALAEKENELEILNLAHDKDIEAIKNCYEKDIEKLQQTHPISSLKNTSTQTESIKTNQKKTISTQTQIESEKFENQDIDDILKEMTSLPALMLPLPSSDENETTVPKHSPIKISPKLKVKNKFSKIIKRNKITNNRLKILTKILGFKRNLTKNTPFVFIPKNCEVKNLSDFLQSESHLSAKYYPNVSLNNSFATPNIFNPYYSYNPMYAQMYPCPTNFCCPQTPCYYQNYVPRLYQHTKRGNKRHLNKSLDERSLTSSTKSSKYNINNFVKSKTLNDFKTECFSNQNSDIDELFDSTKSVPKRRKRIIVYSSDENSDIEVSYDNQKDPETMSIASTISDKNVKNFPKFDSYTSSNLSAITLTSSFDSQTLNNLDTADKVLPVKEPLEPKKINLSPPALNSNFEKRNNSFYLESKTSNFENQNSLNLDIPDNLLANEPFKPKINLGPQVLNSNLENRHNSFYLEYKTSNFENQNYCNLDNILPANEALQPPKINLKPQVSNPTLNANTLISQFESQNLNNLHTTEYILPADEPLEPKNIKLASHISNPSLKAISLTPSLESQNSSNLDYADKILFTEEPFELIPKLILAPQVLNSNLENQNSVNSNLCLESKEASNSNLCDKVDNLLETISGPNEMLDSPKLVDACPKTFAQTNHCLKEANIGLPKIKTCKSQDFVTLVSKSFALDSEKSDTENIELLEDCDIESSWLGKEQNPNCIVENFNCILGVVNSKNLVQSNSALSQNLEENVSLSKQEKLTLACTQSDLALKQNNVDISPPENCTNLKTNMGSVNPVQSNLAMLQNLEENVSLEQNQFSFPCAQSEFSLEKNNLGISLPENVMYSNSIKDSKDLFLHNLALRQNLNESVSLSGQGQSSTLCKKTNLDISTHDKGTNSKSTARSKKTVQPKSKKPQKLKENMLQSENQLILPHIQSDLIPKNTNLVSSLSDNVTDLKTTMIENESNLESRQPKPKIIPEIRISNSDSDKIQIQNLESDKTRPISTNLAKELSERMHRIVPKLNLNSSISQIRRSVRLKDKINPYLPKNRNKKVIIPIGNSYKKVQNLETSKLTKPNDNALGMLGFSSEEIANNPDKRASLILRDFISKYEMSLLDSSIEIEDDLHKNPVPISKENKIETPVGWDLVTLHKQKRRVAHKSTPKRNKRLSSKKQNLLKDIFDSSDGSEMSFDNRTHTSISKMLTMNKQNNEKTPPMDSSEEEVQKPNLQEERIVDKNDLKENTQNSPIVYNLRTLKTNQTLVRQQRNLKKCGGQIKLAPVNNSNNELRVFKRPVKSKYVFIPDTPRSPDFIEYVKEDPKIIPLKRVTSMKIKILVKYVDKLLNGDLDEEKYRAKIQIVAKQEAEKISKAIVEVASMDLSQECDKTFTPLAPLMTKTQQRTFVLVKKLLEYPGQEDLPELILQNLEKLILVDDRLDFLLTHTRLYVGLSMIYFNVEKVRLLCINAAYKLGDYILPFMFLTLTMYPEVLPTKEKLADQTALEQCLPRVLVKIMRRRHCTKPGFNCNNLKQFLKQFYGYTSESENENDLLEDLVKLYIETCSKLVYTAIILLCKNFPNSWTHQQINKYFIPLVNKNLLNSNCVDLVVLTIHMITRLVQPIFYDQEDKNLLQSVLDWIQGFVEVNNTLTYAIRTAISICSVQLSRQPLYETNNKVGQKKKGKKKASKKKKPNNNSQ